MIPVTFHDNNAHVEKIEIREDMIRVQLKNGLVVEIDTSPDFQALHYGHLTADAGWLKFEDMGVPVEKMMPRP